MKSKLDKYDKAVKYLTKHPEEIGFAWSEGRRDYNGIGCLFQFAKKGRCTTANSGCLTMIRGSTGSVAANKQLTKEIRADKRLPKSEDKIRVEHLPVFAEWQRRLDKELGR